MLDLAMNALHKAIARNTGAVLSLPTAGKLCHYRTRFLGESQANDTDGFWIESVIQEIIFLQELIAAQTRVGIAYKAGETKCIFATPILKHQPDYHVNRALKVDALLLAFPQTIKSLQRRALYRVHICPEMELAVRAWRIPDHVALHDKPLDSLELAFQVRDLSIGGIGFVCPPKNGPAPHLACNQRLRIEIRYQQITVLLEGHVKHNQLTPDQSLRVGIQFDTSEGDLECRRAVSKLTTIVGQLHRQEVRRLSGSLVA
ncbi:MAG: PilZ domain-containing protein [Bacillota bacterium]